MYFKTISKVCLPALTNKQRLIPEGTDPIRLTEDTKVWTTAINPFGR